MNKIRRVLILIGGALLLVLVVAAIYSFVTKTIADAGLAEYSSEDFAIKYPEDFDRVVDDERDAYIIFTSKEGVSPKESLEILYEQADTATNTPASAKSFYELSRESSDKSTSVQYVEASDPKILTVNVQGANNKLSQKSIQLFYDKVTVTVNMKFQNGSKFQKQQDRILESLTIAKQ